jgi:hypothetical protein
MKDTVNETEESVEEEEAAPDLEEAEPSAADLADATVPPDPALGTDVESIQEIVAKQEAAAEDEDEAEEDAVPLTREEKLAEPADAPRVVPIQETEFTCRRCFLVKHRSQLANKKKMLCRDCA